MELPLATTYKHVHELLLQNNNEDAIPILRQIIKAMPLFGEAHYNLGLALCKMDKDDEAIEVLNRAAELRPEDWQAHSVMARCYGNKGEFGPCVAHLKEALRIEPENKQTQWKLSYYLLMQGKFDEAAPYEEWWRTCGARARIKTWYGHRPPGKTVFVYPDGGIGDSINYFRYCLLLPDIWGVDRVFVGCYSELREMFARAMPRANLIDFGPVASRNNGSECILNWDIDVPITDACAYQSDLFPIFGFKHHGETVPYITADQKKVQEWGWKIKSQFGYDPNYLRIGVIWQGHTGANNDDKRSFPLSYFKPLDEIPGIRLYALQAKYGLEQVASSGVDLVNLGYQFDVNSMEDMAAALEHMDLTISVCTGGAHVAGAMGKPVWLLLSKLACWRWLRDRSDTPFYPTMRLFRQEYDNDWHKVIHSVCHELVEWRKDLWLSTQKGT